MSTFDDDDLEGGVALPGEVAPAASVEIPAAIPAPIATTTVEPMSMSTVQTPIATNPLHLRQQRALAAGAYQQQLYLQQVQAQAQAQYAQAAVAQQYQVAAAHAQAQQVQASQVNVIQPQQQQLLQPPAKAATVDGRAVFSLPKKVQPAHKTRVLRTDGKASNRKGIALSPRSSPRGEQSGASASINSSNNSKRSGVGARNNKMNNNLNVNNGIGTMGFSGPIHNVKPKAPDTFLQLAKVKGGESVLVSQNKTEKAPAKVRQNYASLFDVDDKTNRLKIAFVHKQDDPSLNIKAGQLIPWQDQLIQSINFLRRETAYEKMDKKKPIVRNEPDAKYGPKLIKLLELIDKQQEANPPITKFFNNKTNKLLLTELFEYPPPRVDSSEQGMSKKERRHLKALAEGDENVTPLQSSCEEDDVVVVGGGDTDAANGTNGNGLNGANGTTATSSTTTQSRFSMCLQKIEQKIRDKEYHLIEHYKTDVKTLLKERQDLLKMSALHLGDCGNNTVSNNSLYSLYDEKLIELIYPLINFLVEELLYYAEVAYQREIFIMTQKLANQGPNYFNQLRTQFGCPPIAQMNVHSMLDPRYNTALSGLNALGTTMVQNIQNGGMSFQQQQQLQAQYTLQAQQQAVAAALQKQNQNQAAAAAAKSAAAASSSSSSTAAGKNQKQSKDSTTGAGAQTAAARPSDTASNANGSTIGSNASKNSKKSSEAAAKKSEAAKKKKEAQQQQLQNQKPYKYHGSATGMDAAKKMLSGLRGKKNLNDKNQNDNDDDDANSSIVGSNANLNKDGLKRPRPIRRRRNSENYDGGNQIVYNNNYRRGERKKYKPDEGGLSERVCKTLSELWDELDQKRSDEIQLWLQPQLPAWLEGGLYMEELEIWHLEPHVQEYFMKKIKRLHKEQYGGNKNSGRYKVGARKKGVKGMKKKNGATGVLANVDPTDKRARYATGEVMTDSENEQSESESSSSSSSSSSKGDNENEDAKDSDGDNGTKRQRLSDDAASSIVSQNNKSGTGRGFKFKTHISKKPSQSQPLPQPPIASAVASSDSSPPVFEVPFKDTNMEEDLRRQNSGDLQMSMNLNNGNVNTINCDKPPNTGGSSLDHSDHQDQKVLNQNQQQQIEIQAKIQAQESLETAQAELVKKAQLQAQAAAEANRLESNPMGFDVNVGNDDSDDPMGFQVDSNNNDEIIINQGNPMLDTNLNTTITSLNNSTNNDNSAPAPPINISDAFAAHRNVRMSALNNKSDLNDILGLLDDDDDFGAE